MPLVTYIVSNTDRFISFEWIIEALNDLDEFTISFILLNHGHSYLEQYLRAQGVPVERIQYQSKKNLLVAIRRTIRLLKRDQPSIVHTHFVDANLVGLTAAKWVGIKSRVHTRHHSTYHHNSHKKGVLLDRYANWLSTRIISISKIVTEVLHNMEGVSKKKISLIPHGIKPDYFNNTAPSDIAALRSKYDLTHQKGPIIGVISRFINWKGIEFTVRGFKALLQEHPNALLILANARGPHTPVIDDELQSIPSENYLKIPFEKNVNQLYQLFDVFVHVPVDPFAEAYGLVYIEALMAGIPSVFTVSGIAGDFVVDRRHALTVDFNNAEQIKEALLEILSNSQLSATLIENGRQTANEYFSFDKMIGDLTNLYTNELRK